MIRTVFLFFVLWLTAGKSLAQKGTYKDVAVTHAGLGWAGNSVNTVVFRKNSLTSNGTIQFIGYYDTAGYMIIGKRNLADSIWELKRTTFKGNISDAHNSISIMLDGDGFLHIAWDHHNNPLHYCKGKEPLSLELTAMMPMTGDREKKLSYPEFHKMPNGDLLFFYRDGGSGNGNLVINKYSVREKKWTRLQSNLIDGEGKRNAYWQACIDAKGWIHISWVWREGPDVASNHDMCYALSKDGGISWQKSTGEQYILPVTLASAEQVCSIAQNSGLINQTSMCADANGHPFIASYWKGKNNVPQYHVMYKAGGRWKVNDLGFRKTNFNLSGMGTKQIPIARPQLVCKQSGNKTILLLVFRDEERGNAVSIASTKNAHPKKWKVNDLYSINTGAWEPTYDTDLWKQKNELHLFVQQVQQADAEGVIKTLPQMVTVLEYKF
jgi:BNR repeat-containing family member